MKFIKLVQFIEPQSVLGENVKIVLHSGGMFNLKVSGCTPDYITGWDDEALNLTVFLEDIAHIVGHGKYKAGPYVQ